MREEKSRISLFFFFLVLSPVWLLTGLSGVQAQETDITQTPNNEQAEIRALKEEMQEAWENEDFARVKEIKEELKEIMSEDKLGLGLGKKGSCTGDYEDCHGKKIGEVIKKSLWHRFQFWKK